MINSFVIENIANGVSVNMGGTGMVQMVSGYWESGSATIAGAVLLTGSQTISGDKTFVNNINTSGTLNIDNLIYLDKVIGTMSAGRIRIYNSSTGELVLSSSNNGNPMLYSVYSGDGATLIPLSITANPILLNPTLGYGGNVGILTSSPQAPLDVSGLILAGSMRISGSSVVLQSQIGNYYPLNENPRGYISTWDVVQGAVQSIGGMTSIVKVTGYGNVTITTGLINGLNGLIFSGTTGTLASTSNLNLTGSNLQDQINSINNNTGIFVSTGQTVAFYPRTNPSGFVRDTQTGSFITTGQTGVFVFTGDTGRFITTGQTGQFSWTGHTHAQYVNTGNTGIFITTGQTGVFYPRTNPSGFIGTLQTGQFATTGELNATGLWLSGWIDDVEINLTSNYLTTISAAQTYMTQTSCDERYPQMIHDGSIAALEATGEFLLNKINILSGNLTNSGNSLQSQINIVSGLSLTGIRAPIVMAGIDGTDYTINWSLSDTFQYAFTKDVSEVGDTAWLPVVTMTGCANGQSIHCSFTNTGLAYETAIRDMEWNGNPAYKVHLQANSSDLRPGCLYAPVGTKTQKHSSLYSFLCIGTNIYGQQLSTNAYYTGDPL